jgi:excisionase family DNA binding protein
MIENVTQSPKLSMLTIPQSAKLLGISQSTLRTLVNSGKIRTLKVGTRNYIDFESMTEFLKSQLNNKSEE